MTKFFVYFQFISFAILTSCSTHEVENEPVLITDEVENNTTTNDIDIILDKGVAKFNIKNEKNQVFEKDALLLTNTSVNAVSYFWDFGNGDTSTEANPTYSYERHGDFKVKLVITDKYGNTSELSDDIKVICLFDGENHDSN